MLNASTAANPAISARVSDRYYMQEIVGTAYLTHEITAR